MKLKNILISFAVILSSLFMTTVKAETAPNSITINGADSYMLYGANYLGNGSSLQFTFKKTTTGKLVYCTEIHDNWFYSGTRTFTMSNTMNARVAYVLKNGEKITGDKNKDYFITGLAVWYLIAPNDSVFTYFDLNAGTYKGVKSDVVGHIAKLVHNSSSAAYVEPTIKLSSNNFTLSSDKKYYVSTLGVTTTGTVGNYTVSLSGAPSGTIVTDTNGNTNNTFAPNAKFLVKVPVSSISALTTSMNVSVSAKGTIYTAYVYSPSDSSVQSVVTAYDKEKNVSDSTALKLNITNETQISKVDATTGKELPGATLVLKDADGKQVDKWVSTNTPHIIKNLEPGKYSLTEIIAPEGYKLSTKTVEFTVEKDGTVKNKVVMPNYPDTYVEISKQDATTGKELPGATLVLKDADGKQIDKWVSTSTPHKIKNLEPGKYTLTETIAPKGYKLSTEKVEFTVEKDGTVKNPVIMRNYPEEPKTTYISKQDATTGKELPGATLVLKDSKGKQIDKWVSTDTPHKIKGLEPGKYTLTETIAPEGYKLSTETVEFTVEKDGTVKNPVVMKNYPDTYVEISKQDATTGEELPGATLVLKDSKGKQIDKWVSTSTPHKIKNLEPGKYTLTETIAPEGYKLSTETVKFTVEKDGTVKNPVVMKNYPEEPKTVYISKQDVTTGEELPGAYLEIKDAKGEVIEAWVSSDTPHKVEGLEPGKYTLTEVIAPYGYELSTETVEFTVKEDGTVDGIVIMYNKPQEVEIPNTASFKTITSSLIGLIIIGLGSMMIYRTYKKNEEI